MNVARAYLRVREGEAGRDDLSDFAAEANGVAKIVLESVEEIMLNWPNKSPAMTMRRAANDSARAFNLRRSLVSTLLASLTPKPINVWWLCVVPVKLLNEPLSCPVVAKARSSESAQSIRLRPNIRRSTISLLNNNSIFRMLSDSHRLTILTAEEIADLFGFPCFSIDRSLIKPAHTRLRRS